MIKNNESTFAAGQHVRLSAPGGHGVAGVGASFKLSEDGLGFERSGRFIDPKQLFVVVGFAWDARDARAGVYHCRKYELGSAFGKVAEPFYFEPDALRPATEAEVKAARRELTNEVGERVHEAVEESIRASMSSREPPKLRGEPEAEALADKLLSEWLREELLGARRTDTLAARGEADGKSLAEHRDHAKTRKFPGRRDFFVAPPDPISNGRGDTPRGFRRALDEVQDPRHYLRVVDHRTSWTSPEKKLRLKFARGLYGFAALVDGLVKRFEAVDSPPVPTGHDGTFAEDDLDGFDENGNPPPSF